MIYTQTVYGLDVKLINDVMELDALVYPEDMRGTFDGLYARFKANRDMFILLYDNIDLVGYLCFFPIKDTLYEQVVGENRMFDTDISGEMIEPYEPNKTYKLYFISAVIHPNHQGKGLSKLLLDGLYQFMLNKQKEDINFSTALATSVTPEGEALCRRLGFIEKKRLPKGYILHELNISDFLSKHKGI